MTMDMVTTLEAHLLMHAQTHQERRPLTATDASMLMEMAIPHQLKVGVSTVEPMLSQAMQHNGATLMRTASETTMEMSHGLIDQRIGLEPTSMVHKTKTHVQCNQEQVGKTES